jgi:FkbM family methyltransferase
MKVAHLSTWQTQCGIAEYTGFLTDALSTTGVESEVVEIDREHAAYLSKTELRAYFDELTERFADADLVHIQHEFGFFSGSYHYRASVLRFRQVLQAAMRAGRPAVTTLHTIPFGVDLASMNWTSGDPVKSLMTIGARGWWRAAIAPLVNRNGGAHAIVHARTARRLLIDSGIKAPSISVIPHGNPAPRPPASDAARREARARLGLSQDSVVIALFGFLSTSKGHLDAVKALERLPDRFQLVLAGGAHPLDRHSSLGDVLDHVAESSDLADRLAVTGFQERAEAERTLDAVDVMIAPYRDPAQISSGALGWALASGKPVIASDIPVFRELVAERDCAVLVPPRSPAELALAIRHLADDPERTRALVANARAWCDETSWSSVAQEHHDLYADLLDGSAARPRRIPTGAPKPVARPTAASGALIAVGESYSSDSEGFALLGPGSPSAMLQPARLPSGTTVVFALDPRSIDDPLVGALRSRGYPGDLPALLILHLLRGGGTFVDVGAHLGTFSLAAAAEGCDVLAIEASPRSARLLRTAATYNGLGNLTVVHGAAAASEGIVRFTSADVWGHVAKPGIPADPGADEVRTYAVDGLVEGLGWDHVDLLKMDIEGYEVEALRGMQRLLAAERPPAILFESNAYELAAFGETIQGLKRIFTDHGYGLYYVDRETPGRLAPMGADDLQPEAVADYLAIKGEPTGLAPWYLEPLTHTELVDHLRKEGARSEAVIRGYVAAAFATASEQFRADPLIQSSLMDLARDPDADVRRVLSGEDPPPKHGLEATTASDQSAGPAATAGAGAA